MTADLGAGVAALCSHLVHLGLCNVSPLLGLLQLVLQLAHLAQICIGLLLLKIKWISKGANDHLALSTKALLPECCFAYRLLSCALVGLHFELQLVHQILQTGQVLFVLLCLVNKFVLLIRLWVTFRLTFHVSIVHTWYDSSFIRLSYLRMPFTESLLLLCSMSTSFSSSLTFQNSP